MNKVRILRDHGGLAVRADVEAKALDFTRWAIALARAEGSPGEAASIFEATWPKSAAVSVIKSAVAAGQIGNGGWGNALTPASTLGEAFAEVIRPRSVIGQLVGYRPMPFNVRAVSGLTGSAISWVREAGVIPLGSMTLDVTSLPARKAAGIIVCSRELVKLPAPPAEALIRADLEAGATAMVDAAFLDPSLAATDSSPASITNGLVPIASSGTDAAAAVADLRALFASITSSLAAPFLIMRRRTALALAGMGATFPDVGANGGAIWGVPVIVTDSAPVSADSPGDDVIIALDAAELLLADEGAQVDLSEHASLQMDSAPDSPPAASAVTVSVWQHGLVAWRVVRFVNWKLRRSGAVAVLQGVAYS